MATIATTRPNTVAIPAPNRPISGKPNLPYIRTQLPNMLSRMPPTVTHMGTEVYSMPFELCASTLYTAIGTGISISTR